MRVCGQQRPFWRLTVNRTDFCTASVPSKPVGVAIPEEKRRELNIGFAWMAVDTWNHIINGACVGTMQDGRRARAGAACVCLSRHRNCSGVDRLPATTSRSSVAPHSRPLPSADNPKGPTGYRGRFANLICSRWSVN